jgi:hypothetical protein
MDVKTPNEILMGQRPTYFNGQLLLKDDFLAEQNYHVEARKLHNLSLYDWGVVSGLTVGREGDKSVRISEGSAIDAKGQEIFLKESTRVDLIGFGPNEKIAIGLAYKEVSNAQGAAENRINCYAAVTLSKDGQASDGLILAIVTLDGQGNVKENGIDYSQTRYARPKPGSITATQLHASLRTGWLRLPFRPSPLVDIPDGEKELPPAFRVGATRTLTPDHDDANMKDRGAGGTMAIPIPPGMTHVTRFRIAGDTNEGEIHLLLYCGGWDIEENKHHRKILLDEKITSDKKSNSKNTGFLETFPIEETKTKLDPEYWTLGVWLRGTRRTSISLIAVELGY